MACQEMICYEFGSSCWIIKASSAYVVLHVNDCEHWASRWQ